MLMKLTHGKLPKSKFHMVVEEKRESKKERLKVIMLLKFHELSSKNGSLAHTVT